MTSCLMIQEKNLLEYDRIQGDFFMVFFTEQSVRVCQIPDW